MQINFMQTLGLYCVKRAFLESLFFWDYIGGNISYISKMFGLYFGKDFASEDFSVSIILGTK